MNLNDFIITGVLGNSDTTSVKKVKYIGATVEQIRWGSNDDPRDLLTEGQIYNVEKIEPHSWHTKYYLKEFPGKKFNSVCFESVREND